MQTLRLIPSTSELEEVKGGALSIKFPVRIYVAGDRGSAEVVETVKALLAYVRQHGSVALTDDELDSYVRSFVGPTGVMASRGPRPNSRWVDPDVYGRIAF